ncbi:hypothetical protein C8R45DRAFT_439015 [Mycena sanguinolenta]|nr:hypothetical protein C8R45DRAFT_439015 [Mycena sanguinolenta]
MNACVTPHGRWRTATPPPPPQTRAKAPCPLDSQRSSETSAVREGEQANGKGRWKNEKGDGKTKKAMENGKQKRKREMQNSEMKATAGRRKRKRPANDRHKRRTKRKRWKPHCSPAHAVDRIKCQSTQEKKLVQGRDGPPRRQSHPQTQDRPAPRLPSPSSPHLPENTNRHQKHKTPKQTYRQNPKKPKPENEENTATKHRNEITIKNQKSILGDPLRPRISSSGTTRDRADQGTYEQVRVRAQAHDTYEQVRVRVRAQVRGKVGEIGGGRGISHRTSGRISARVCFA